MEEKSLILIQYEYITEPVNIIEVLNTDEKFTEWLSEGSVDDLHGTLKVFEKAELYHHCALIVKELDRKRAL